MPQSSYVVPFGCAVLALRDSDDRAKFTNRAVMMVFVYYSEDHPLFTYALYSPRTKRILHRQDVIFLTFLTSVFPMRSARVGSGLGPEEGDTLTVFPVPSLLDGSPLELSFGDWDIRDDLPVYDDGVSGFQFSAPYGSFVDVPEELDGVLVHKPCQPSSPPSSIMVPVSAAPFLPDVQTALSPDRSLVSPVPTVVTLAGYCVCSTTVPCSTRFCFSRQVNG
jgi:hypothetical protein